MKHLGLCLTLSLASIGLASAADAISFARDIAPVLKSRCATCHLTGEEAGGMALYPAAAYASIVAVPSLESRLMRIKPGAPDESYLLLKVEGRHLDAGGSGQRMPFGEAPLDEAILQRLRNWIAAGALDN